MIAKNMKNYFKNYGINLKYGIYENYGQKKDKLEDLILFTTINKDKSSTLAEYVEAMPEGQRIFTLHQLRIRMRY